MPQTEELEISPLQRLETYLFNALNLRKEIALFEYDKMNEANGWVHHYAVDTDVVKMYANPQTDGMMHGRRVGYGAVFFDDDKNTSTALAAAVARFLFFDLATPERPFFLMHGHDAETRGVFDVIAREATDDSYLKLAKRREMLLQLNRIELSSVSTLDELEQQFPFVMDYLFTEQGAVLEFDRFKELLAHRSVARFAFGILNAGYYRALFDKHPEIRTAFDVPSSLGDQADESKFRTNWGKRLKKRGLKGKADYSALSRIELVNQKLAPYKHRLILITGDTRMIQAGQSYFPNDADINFSQKFLRHPRAFLAAPEVIAPFEETEKMQEGYSPVLLSQWLDYLLAYLDEDESYTSRNKVNLDHRKLANDINEIGTIENFANNIRDQWSEHVAKLNDYYGASNSSAKKILRRYSDIGDSEEFNSNLSKLLDNAISASEVSWTNFVDVLVNAGFVFLETEQKQNVYIKRNAPPVLLEKFRSAYSVIKRLTTTADDPLTARELIEQLGFLGSETTSGYMRALAYSVLFASRDRWAVCRQLLNQALNFVEDDSRTESGALITGREALFLKSIASRMLAKSVDDLDEAENSLKLARQAYHKEDIKGQEWLGIRFDCESVSIRLSRHLFEHFDSHTGTENECKKDLDCIVSDYEELLSNIDHVPDKWIALNLERSICVNLITVDSIYGPNGLDKDIVATAYSRLTENIDRYVEGYHLPESFLVKVIRIYGASKFTIPTRKGRKDLRDKMVRFQYLLREDPTSIIVTPYDRARYQHLFRLAQLNLLKVWPS